MADQLDSARLAVPPQDWSRLIILTLLVASIFGIGILLYNNLKLEEKRINDLFRRNAGLKDTFTHPVFPKRSEPNPFSASDTAARSGRSVRLVPLDSFAIVSPGAVSTGTAQANTPASAPPSPAPVEFLFDAHGKPFIPENTSALLSVFTTVVAASIAALISTNRNRTAIDKYREQKLTDAQVIAYLALQLDELKSPKQTLETALRAARDEALDAQADLSRSQEDRIRLQKLVTKLTGEREHIVVALVTLIQTLHNASTTRGENARLIQATIERLEVQKELATQLETEKAQLRHARDVANTADLKDEKATHERVLHEQLQASELDTTRVFRNKQYELVDITNRSSKEWLRDRDLWTRSEKSVEKLTEQLTQLHQANEATANETKGMFSKQLENILSQQEREIEKTKRLAIEEGNSLLRQKDHVIDGLEREIAKLQMKAIQIEPTSEKQSTASNEERKKLEAEVGEKPRLLEQLQEAQRKLKEQKATHADELQALETEISKKNTDVDTAQREKREVADRLRQLEIQDKEVTQTHQKLAELKQLISDEDTQIELLKSEKSSQQKENGKLEQHISTTAKKMQMLEEDDASMREAISAMQAALSDLSAEVESSKQQVEYGDFKAKEHLKQLRKADEMVTAKMVAYHELAALCQSQQAEFDRFTERYAELEAKHAKVEDDLRVALKQLFELENRTRQDLRIEEEAEDETLTPNEAQGQEPKSEDTYNYDSTPAQSPSNPEFGAVKFALQKKRDGLLEHFSHAQRAQAPIRRRDPVQAAPPLFRRALRRSGYPGPRLRPRRQGDRRWESAEA
ncbi:hypothetical protein TW65_06009 [Stemphylium lycopersici]|nr:hypothetical protein TW65_06009 [Stemphylium lycopersici]